MGTKVGIQRFPWVGWRDVRLGARLAVVSVAAMVVARVLGLHAFYWAGISALIVSTGSPGGSLTAGLARLGGTLVGLGIGVGAVMFLGHSLLAAGLAIALAILVCQGLGLKSAAKVGALTTLFPVSAVTDPHGLVLTLSTSFGRAENVLVGCVTALLLDWVLWPDHPAEKLAERLRQDVALAGDQAAGWLRTYIQDSAPPSEPTLQELLESHTVHSELLNALGTEPEEREAPRARFMAQMASVHALTEHCHALKELVHQSSGDQVQALLEPELRAMAEGLESCGRAFAAMNEGDRPLAKRALRPPRAPHGVADGDEGFRGALKTLGETRSRLDLGYAKVRGDQGTQAYPVEEVFHFLGVISACHGLEQAMQRIGQSLGQGLP